MLGETLSDPFGVEAGGSMKGMGLIPMDTVFAKAKTRTRVSGTFREIQGNWKPFSGAEVAGYEIHMGDSVLKDGVRSFTRIIDSVSGAEKEDGAYWENVCGTYVHGVFDCEAAAKALIRVL